MLSLKCKLQNPIQHKNSALRSAGEANAVDLLNNLDMLDSEKRAPRYLVPSEDLGSVPLGALAVRDEVSVSARLESLEETMRKVCLALEKVQSSSPFQAPARPDTAVPNSGPATFASIAAGVPPTIVVSPAQQQAHDHNNGQGPQPQGGVGAGSLGTKVGNGTRARTRSESVKRKADEETPDQDGFRKQGRQRQRKVATGTSQVNVDGVGEYIAPVEYYIGNTDKRTNEETIRTVLKRCASAVEGGGDLVVEHVELLTKEKEPRTKCWKVVVPYRIKTLMEKDEVYLSGWRHRKFFGSRNSKDKKLKLDQGLDVEQQVLIEQQKEADQLLKEEEKEALLLKIQQLESRMTNSTGNQVQSSP